MGNITPDKIQEFAEALESRESYVASQHAVTINGINAASENNALSLTNTSVFSHEIQTVSISDQKRSGRCWLFAALNVVRHQIANEYKMDDLMLSQSYLYFWDKLEKSNTFLEKIVASANDPLEDRWVTQLMTSPQAEGGWWEYAASLIKKYGVVPISAMPEAVATTHSTQLNTLIDRILRQAALSLREQVGKKASSTEIERIKNTALADVYRVLTIAIGTPPKEFSFSYKDKDKKYHRDDKLTPQAFFKKYSKMNLDDYITLVNDPTPGRAFNTPYVLKDGENMVGGMDVVMFNVEVDSLVDLTSKQIKKSEPVWIGLEVQEKVNKKGYMALDVYDYESTFNIDFMNDKAQRLLSRDASVSHAMTIVGVDLVKNKPRQWKVENSWGDKPGNKGYYTMSTGWFKQNGYMVVIRKDLLSETQHKALAKKPIEIPYWDHLNAMRAE